jgi:hypothetical protein
MLINENSNYFIARAENKKEIMELLINTKRWLQTLLILGLVT